MVMESRSAAEHTSRANKSPKKYKTAESVSNVVDGGNRLLVCRVEARGCAEVTGWDPTRTVWQLGSATGGEWGGVGVGEQGEWVEYDEKEGCVVSVSEIKGVVERER